MFPSEQTNWTAQDLIPQRSTATVGLLDYLSETASAREYDVKCRAYERREHPVRVGCPSNVREFVPSRLADDEHVVIFPRPNLRRAQLTVVQKARTWFFSTSSR